MTSPGGCGCGGGGAASTATGQVFAVLINGSKMGSYPTEAHAEVARRTVYKGNGTVVAR